MSGRNIFLAAPISGFQEKKEYEDYRLMLTNLIAFLRENGHTVYSEIENVYDDTCYDSPGKSAMDDFSKISECDTFLMLHPKRMQTSTFIELGYACAKSKKLVIVGDMKDLPYLAQGLEESERDARIINQSDLNEVVFEWINDIMME
ncbi:MAG: nucleoside 2-deoxyribosyltransferase domain-containing protein [Lachnospiraceae bacterium]|nr:nucleoside 2-deoxyribosyltransferase domain-containing protein [Lachnospiraceae bacterium]